MEVQASSSGVLRCSKLRPKKKAGEVSKGESLIPFSISFSTSLYTKVPQILLTSIFFKANVARSYFPNLKAFLKKSNQENFD
jgi:hypothetical protein